MDEEEIDAGRILRSVPYEVGFHFTENGVYSGVTAVSLSDFSMKLRVVPLSSILFHYPRSDFQNWVSSTLGDEELANRLSSIKSGLSGKSLKMNIIKIVRNRLNELEVLKTQKYLKYMAHVHARETK